MDEIDTDGDQDTTARHGSGEADDDARLADLGDRIQSVRAEAEDAVEGVAEPEEEYVDSGSERSAQEDDQTIAPPG